ncbi:MAG: ABC transporter substrate-binding protein [Clostridia bacterium]
MTKLLKKLLLITLISTLVLVGCTNEDTTEPDEQKKEELTILQGVDATSLDPAMHSDSPSGNVDHQIFDTLLKRNNDMELEPSVFTEWEMIDDLTWEFSIKEGIKFHNGDTLTTEDVKFSIDRIVNPDTKSTRRSHYSFIESINVLDSNKVSIKTKEPSPILLARLAALEVVPKNYIEEVGNSEFSQNPIGSGPFKFDEWVKDERIVLKAFEDHWQGEPPIKEVIFKPVPEAASRVMALQAGEADLITNVPPHSAGELEEAQGVRVEEVPSSRVMFLTFTTSNETVKHLKVRQAIELAVDSKSIVESLFSNKATVSSQIISVFDLGYDEEVLVRESNIEKAKELLKEADAENITLNLKSPSGRYTLDKEVAQAVAAQIGELGITVNLQFEDFNNYVSKIINGTMDADLWLIGWGNGTFDAGATLNQWLHTDNSTAYYSVDDNTNNTVDNLIEEALVTLDDQKREDLYNQVIKQVVADTAFINLYQQNDIYGVIDELNWSARGDELIDLFNASWK